MTNDAYTSLDYSRYLKCTGSFMGGSNTQWLLRLIPGSELRKHFLEETFEIPRIKPSSSALQGCTVALAQN